MRLAAFVSLMATCLLVGCTASVSPDAEADRGLALARQGRLDEALEAFQQALEAEPSHPKALYNQGMAFLGLSQWNDAVVSFGRFVETRPDDAAGWFDKARAETLAGMREDGLRSLQRAVSLGFSDYGLLVKDGVFMPLFRDARFVGLEMTVAQRAGVEPDAGTLAVRGATLGPGSHLLPTMELPGIGRACAAKNDDDAMGDAACAP